MEYAGTDDSTLTPQGRQGIDDWVARKTSTAKLEANRANAKRSTGPKSARGKALAKYNARRHGLFAVGRLIPGEDKHQHEKLASRLIAELTPSCSIGAMLVDQIIGDLWRLQRLEQAETAYLRSVQEAVFDRLRRARPDRPLASLDGRFQDCPPDGAACNIERPQGQPQSVPSGTADSGASDKRQFRDVMPVPESQRSTFDGARILGSSLLEALVDPSRAFPHATLDQIRRSLVRNILRNYDRLGVIQNP